ncbi:MAG: HAD family hydrolase [Anaerolineae bacterium]|nr:HAD family hydrolase [Anaerolineae bacterium]
MKLLIWDFDGTLGYRDSGMWSGSLMELLASEAPGIAVAQETLSAHLREGYPWHTPEVAHTDVRNADDWWERLYPAAERALLAVGLDEARAQALARRLRPVYTNLDRWRLYDDTLPTLRCLSAQGWTHVVLSNHVPELRAIVAHLGLDAHIAQLFNSAETGYEKPHPQALAMVRQAFPSADPIWVIGDSPGADVAGARQAGLPAILVRRPQALPEEIAQAQHYGADLGDVLAILSQAE